MGGPPFFQNKSQLFSILACHGHTSQRLSILFSENVTPLSVWTNFVSDLDGKRTSNASQTHQFCELEPGQHDTYIYSLTQLAEARAQRRLIGCRPGCRPGCRFLLGLKSDENRWEVLHFSKTSRNSFRFWHVMVTPLNVWAYFFSKMSHLSTSGRTFSQKWDFP